MLLVVQGMRQRTAEKEQKRRGGEKGMTTSRGNTVRDTNTENGVGCAQRARGEVVKWRFQNVFGCVCFFWGGGRRTEIIRESRAAVSMGNNRSRSAHALVCRF